MTARLSRTSPMRLRLALAFAVLVAGVGPGRAASTDISAPKIIAFASGTCSVTVNGADVGCQGKAIGTVLANGHHLFDFTSKDLDVVGFAGTRVQRIEPTKPTLWVERVYLGNNQYEADGSCSYETEDASDKAFHKVECKALLHDGRKIVATLDGTSSGKPDSMTAQAGRDTDPEGNPESSCEKLVRLHGMLSRAQFQCGYGSYNRGLINQAAECAHDIGEAKMKDKIESGMHDFDANEKEKGHKGFCSELLRVFPQFVRK